MESRWINHDGRQILLVDFSDLGEDTAALRNEITAVLLLIQQEPKSSILGLVDFRGTVLSTEVISTL